MPDAPIISVEHVSKAYRIWATPAQRLLSPVFAQLAAWLPGPPGAALARKARVGYQDFFALTDVSFTVGRGEAVGIIGRNGAGKSTLLQIICGTTQATSGSVRVNGRVAALLELGSGFNPEFTGRENVYLTGAILGLTRAEMQARFDGIAAFAEIGEFIDQPTKTYSSGMMVRLAFAVQTAVEPDVLIVDEALSVGDFFFQQKCFKRIAELRERGTTILFVSHDMRSIRDLCQHCLYLRNGRTQFWGSQHDAIRKYFMEQSEVPDGRDPAAVVTPKQAKPDNVTMAPIPVALVPEASTGSEQTVVSFMESVIWGPGIGTHSTPAVLRIRGLKFLDEQGMSTTIFTMGSELRLELLVTAEAPCVADISCTLIDQYQQTIACLGTYTSNTGSLQLARGENAIITFLIRLNFEAGLYSLFFSAARPGTEPNRSSGDVFDATPLLGPIEIKWDYENRRAPFLGRFGPEVKVILTKIGHAPQVPIAHKGDGSD